MSDEDPDYELVMPFVVVESNGGPFDDAAYVAGWEMGQIDMRLKMCAEFGLGLPTLTIRRDNLPQLDLVAMRYGMTTRERTEHYNDDNADAWSEWALVELAWSTEP